VTSSFSPAVRRLIAATLVNTLGNGVYAAVAALYLTRAVGLSVAHVGVGLTVAALVGLVASTPLGVVADRLGPNRAYVGFLLLQAGSLALLASSRSSLASSDGGIVIQAGSGRLSGVPFRVVGGLIPPPCGEVDRRSRSGGD